MTAKLYTSKLNNAIAATSNTVVKSGGEGINLLSGTTFDCWKPDAVGASSCFCSFDAGAAIDVDYFAIDGHNLADIDFSGIILDGDTDPAFPSPTIIEFANKVDIIDGANIFEFTSTNFRYFRLRLTHTTTFTVDPIITVLYVGELLALPEGIKPSYTPPRLGVVSEILNNVSQGSHFIGRSVKRKKYEFTIKNENIARSWITTNWLDLLAYIETKPFFYLWNDDYSDEGVFCWTDKKIKPATYQDTIYFRFAFKCTGFY